MRCVAEHEMVPSEVPTVQSSAPVVVPVLQRGVYGIAVD